MRLHHRCQNTKIHCHDMSIKKTLQNKNKKRFTKEEYKYIESVWNVKNYITGQHHFLVNFAPII